MHRPEARVNTMLYKVMTWQPMTVFFLYKNTAMLLCCFVVLTLVTMTTRHPEKYVPSGSMFAPLFISMVCKQTEGLSYKTGGGSSKNQVKKLHSIMGIYRD